MKDRPEKCDEEKDNKDKVRFHFSLVKGFREKKEKERKKGKEKKIGIVCERRRLMNFRKNRKINK